VLIFSFTLDPTSIKLSLVSPVETRSKTILAAGGQHGELYITNLPSSSTPHPLDRFNHPLKPFTISQTLQTRSINNSMILLPSYPAEWARQAERRKVGHKSRKEMEDEMIIDERDEDDIEIEEEVVEPNSPLTYPNTVPFLHRPRMSISPRPTPMEIEERTSRRTVSFSDREEPRVRVSRQSFSISRLGLPPIEYVTSRTLPGYGVDIETERQDPRIRKPLKRPTSWSEHIDEPRLLISNNDLSIKMFSLRPTPSSPTPAPAPHAQYHYHPSAPFASSSWRANATLPMPIPRIHRSTGLGDDEPVYRDSSRHQRLEGDNIWMRAGDGQGVQRAAERPVPVVNGEERKLVRLGMTQFKCAINHCTSLSLFMLARTCVKARLTSSILITRSQEYGLRRRLRRCPPIRSH